MKMVSSTDIQNVMSSALDVGDDVLIHASLKNIGYFEDGLESLIQCICEAVGDTGTVIMMTDTRSFVETGRFSLDQPSETGLLTEIFRRKEGVLRSPVPMVSFCAFGARAASYTEAYNSLIDETSPINRLLKNDGKIMLFGVGYKKCTLYHLSEERYQVPYNVYKTFKGMMFRDGKPLSEISQRYFVRKDLSVKKNPAIVGKMLEQDDLVRTFTLGDGKVRVFRARDFDECSMKALANDPNAFLECAS